MKNILLPAILLACSFGGNAQNWDINLLKNINPQQPNNGTWQRFSSSAEPLAIAIPSVLLIKSLADKDSILKNRSLEMLGSVVIAAVATEALKIVVNRQRPYEKYPLDVFPYDASEKGKSFPSAHTSLAFSTATSVSLSYRKWYITIPAFAWATGVGYSRLYLGEHYPSDVLAGALVGTGSALLAHWLNKKYFRRR